MHEIVHNSWDLVLCSAYTKSPCFCNFINPRRACAARVTVVGSVCLSVTLHLTSRMSVRLKNNTIYLTGTEGQKIRAVFSKTASFERYGVICVSRQRARPYLVFVTTQASLLVKRLTRYSALLQIRVNECRSMQATFSEAPSF